MTANRPVTTAAGVASGRKISCPVCARVHPVTPAGLARMVEARPLATFSEPGLELTVSADTPVTASPSERTIEGIVVPFGPAGRTSGGLLTFGAGGLRWSKPERVKLLVEHDQATAVGYATALEERPEGLWARFNVPEGPEGDRVLTQAANGVRDAFSVGVMLDAAVEANLRRAQGNAIKGTGQLREVSMVSVPAFDDARVGGSVAASSTRLVVSGWADSTPTTEGNTMNDTQRRRLAALLAKASTGTLTAEEQTERESLEQLATAAGVTVTAADNSAAGPSSAPTGSAAGSTTTASSAASSEPPAVVTAAAGSAVTVASEPATYTLDGSGPSLVRDAWAARMEGDADAAERVRRFNAELNGNNRSSVAALATAAVETTTTAPNVVDTLHRPDLMRAFIDAKRPLISQVSTITLTNANPFSIPSVGEFSGVGDHTEGTSHVAEGDLLFGGDTVTPRAASGAYRISRELIDSSNPILDRIAVRKMVKDYRRYTEGKAWATWSNGLVADLSISKVSQLDTELDNFINADEETADFVALSPSFLTTLKADVDTSGRPHLARYSPVNATAELTGSRTGLVAVFGDTKAIRAASVTATKALIARAEGLLWAESRVQQFSFSEVEGPGIVKLALWAYVAAAVLEPTDVKLLDADATA